jgi:hypothetical protein
MRGFKVTKVLVGENLVENAVSVPGCAAADEFSISSSKRVENGVVEILIICHEIKLIRIYHIKRWTSDSFRVVWKSLNATPVNEVELRFLRLKNNTRRKLMRESCYT